MKDNIKLSKKYYLESDDSINLIYNACSCFEQFEYLVLKNYDINPCFVFCNDIIPKYIQMVNQHIICRNFFNINEGLFTNSVIEIVNNDYFNIIKKLIDNNNLVAFSTKFNMLPPYGWYKGEDDHSFHTAIIIDYDEDNYYFLDAPSVLEPKRTVKHFKNKEISLINQKILHEAFNYICKLSTLNINIDNLNNLKSTKEILKNIESNYYNSSTEYYTDKIIFYGKSALNKMYESITSPDFKFLRQTIFNNHWDLHLILSRHIILKVCIEEDPDFINSLQNKKILFELNKCIELWEELKSVVFKNSIKKINDYRKRIKYIFEKILIQEENFINLIRYI